VYLCVTGGSQNKQRLFPYTKLSKWFLGAFAKLRKANMSFPMSVRPSIRMELTGSNWADFRNIKHLKMFLKFVEKIKFHQNLTKIMDDLRENQYTFIITSRSIPLITRNDTKKKKVVEKIKTHILRSLNFSAENRADYEIMWKNIAQSGRPQMIIRRMPIAEYLLCPKEDGGLGS
jgi:hypothetical protein